MAFLAVLDACALYPFALRDTLLRLAALELFDVRWSAEILDEMSRNLAANHAVTPESAARIVDLMNRFFDEALVPSEAIDQLIPAMRNAEEDRHVLAAAQASGAEAVVTFNLADFPEDATAPLGIDAIHPDEFLQTLFSINPESVTQSLREQAADLTNPPWTLETLLGALEQHVPEFVQGVRVYCVATEPVD